MKYVSWLRGINVGGNAKVSMKDLVKLFSDQGYKNVKTYINSGNVIFEANVRSEKQLQDRIEQVLYKQYGFEIRVVVLTLAQFQGVMQQIPGRWNSDDDIRRYVAFTRLPATPEEVVVHMKPRDGVDTVETGAHAVYMTTVMEGLTKSGFTKLVGTPIYKDITIRNYTTCKKVLAMMS